MSADNLTDDNGGNPCQISKTRQPAQNNANPSVSPAACRRISAVKTQARDPQKQGRNAENRANGRNHGKDAQGRRHQRPDIFGRSPGGFWWLGGSENWRRTRRGGELKIRGKLRQRIQKNPIRPAFRYDGRLSFNPVFRDPLFYLLGGNRSVFVSIRTEDFIHDCVIRLRLRQSRDCCPSIRRALSRQ